MISQCIHYLELYNLCVKKILSLCNIGCKEENMNCFYVSLTANYFMRHGFTSK